MKTKILQFTLASMLILPAGQALATPIVLDTFLSSSGGGTTAYYLVTNYELVGSTPTDVGISWSAAQQFAGTLGGTLATIGNQETQDLIWNRWGSWNQTPTSLWIGLTDRNVEGTFEWVDGSYSGPGSYAETSGFAPGEPNNLVAGNEDYVYMGGQYASTGKWNDYIDSNTHSTPAPQKIYGVVQVSVPDGGATFALLGCSMVGLLALGSRRCLGTA